MARRVPSRVPSRPSAPASRIIITGAASFVVGEQGVRHRLQRQPARRLDQHHVARAEGRAQVARRARPCPPDTVDARPPAAATRRPVSAANAADRQRARRRPARRRQPRPRGGPARRSSPSSSMSPRAATRRPPGRRRPREAAQGGGHRVGVGVVGVVEDRQAVGALVQLHAPARQRGRGAERGRDGVQVGRPAASATAAAASALATLCWRRARAGAPDAARPDVAPGGVEGEGVALQVVGDHVGRPHAQVGARRRGRRPR